MIKMSIFDTIIQLMMYWLSTVLEVTHAQLLTFNSKRTNRRPMLYQIPHSPKSVQENVDFFWHVMANNCMTAGVWSHSPPESGIRPKVKVSHLKETPTPGPVCFIWTLCNFVAACLTSV